MGPKFDVSSDKGLAAFNGFMGSKSYVEGYAMSAADTAEFDKLRGQCPDAAKLPHAYRWYIHIAALSGVRGGGGGGGAAVAAPAAPAAPAPAPAAKKSAAGDDKEDDFDVFGDDGDEDGADADGAPKESRADMLARLKLEAEERTIAKEAKQRTLVAIEIKPWDVEQDLMILWKKVTETITQDGLKWAENCSLVDVAFGIKKIQTTFVMGATNSSDDVVDKILEMEDEVQSCEVISMNVL